MITLRDLNLLLGFNRSYEFYTGVVSAGSPKKINVLQDLERPSRRGWIRNDSAAVSLYVITNGNSDRIEVKPTEMLPLDYLIVASIKLSCDSGSVAYRCLVW